MDRMAFMIDVVNATGVRQGDKNWPNAIKAFIISQKESVLKIYQTLSNMIKKGEQVDEEYYAEISNCVNSINLEKLKEDKQKVIEAFSKTEEQVTLEKAKQTVDEAKLSSIDAYFSSDNTAESISKVVE